ncbi:MAG TPA: hypothetical protein VEQ63_03780 [Bryobacteraceae bacterium]|nr:hypothetical protein [Bryobacteraceae bacterium]
MEFAWTTIGEFVARTQLVAKEVRPAADALFFESSGWQRVQVALMDALAPHGDARKAVADALRRLDQKPAG